MDEWPSDPVSEHAELYDIAVRTAEQLAKLIQSRLPGGWRTRGRFDPADGDYLIDVLVSGKPHLDARRIPERELEDNSSDKDALAVWCSRVALELERSLGDGDLERLELPSGTGWYQASGRPRGPLSAQILNRNGVPAREAERVLSDAAAERAAVDSILRAANSDARPKGDQS